MEHKDIKPHVRVKFKKDVDRYPHGRWPVGTKGWIQKIEFADDGSVQEIHVRLDEHFDSLDEWDNCVIWYDAYTDKVFVVDEFLDDVEQVKVSLLLSYNSRWNEYSVRWIEEGKTDEEKTYRTDDRDDAVATMEAMAERHSITDFK